MSKPELKVIGVGGQRRMGKDVLSDYLAPRLIRSVSTPCHGGGTFMDDPWGRGSFAGEVKRIYCRTFGKTPAFIEEWKTRDECPPGMTMPVRKALTFIGDGFRGIQPDIWIETAFRPENEPYGKVFSDVRYINEARKIASEGGANVLIYRENGLNWDDSLSEAELRPYLQWCVETGREGAIADWSEVKCRKFAFSKSKIFLGLHNDLIKQWGEFSSDRFFRNLTQFHLFVRAADGVANVYAKADGVVLPHLRANYSGI